ncbi:Peroxisomal adenine nucleotide transporter 1 [Zalerion maritima]|uniref:Peroxisomal adenine nucleotide transporter 1 n=1 Tax=Zalerion maritima TaxID=339359 RepID=A0AAD5WPN9_9PEZI|nr:Peroxisomal adenine nucleotide transporter 1 [Zalerion maritima]
MASTSAAWALTHLASGAISAGMTTMTTQPLDNAVVRSQLSRILRKEGHTISLSGGKERQGQGREGRHGTEEDDSSIASLLAREGGLALPSVRRMFREADVAQRGLETGVFFGVYALLKGSRTDVYGTTAMIPAYEELGLGLFSGAMGRAVGVGISNMLSNNNTETSSSPRRGSKGLKKSLRKLRVKDVLASLKGAGADGVFRGYFSGGFVRGAVEPGMTLAIEQILARALLSGGGTERGLLEIMFLAVAGKMIATLVSYPFRTARARMVASKHEDIVSSLGENGNGHSAEQAEKLIDLSDEERVSLGESPFRDGKQKYGTVFEAIRHVYHTEGVGALYDGVGSEMVRAVVHHVILMVGKELIHRVILRVALAVTGFWNRRMVKMVTSADGTVGMMKYSSQVPTVPKVPAPTMKAANLFNTSTTAQPAAAPPTKSTMPTVQPPRIRSLHTNQYLPRPGERPWNMQPQQAPTTVRLARAGELDASNFVRDKAWSLQNQGSGFDFGDRLGGGPKPPAPKWTERLPNIPWRRKSVDEDAGSLVTNMLGEGSRRV